MREYVPFDWETVQIRFGDEDVLWPVVQCLDDESLAFVTGVAEVNCRFLEQRDAETILHKPGGDGTEAH